MPAPAINLAEPHGIWRPVYARRQALHATADTTVLTAWRKDLHGVNLQPAIAAWQQAIGETITPAQQHRREAAAAAILAVLSARSWRRAKAALALAAQQAHRAGWAAGHAIVTQDPGDDTAYDDEPENTVASADMSQHAADATATATLSAILTATARRAGRHLADATDDPEDAAQAVLDDGYDATLATDTAISAAYGLGLLAAYVAANCTSVSVITAGDGRVCQACITAEDDGPYALLDAPRIPLHARCRCILASN